MSRETVVIDGKKLIVIDPDALQPGKTYTFRFPTLEESELMERARRGDQSAYDTLVKQFEHIPMIIGTKEGLTYEEELSLIADRFEMTKEEALKAVVHAVYITGIGHSALREAIDVGYSKLSEDECIRAMGCNCDGTPIEEDEEEEVEDVPF